jgi:hypothetical protein
MTFKSPLRPATLLGLTLATVLAGGCQSMSRTSGTSDASSPGSTMGNTGSTGPTTTRRSGMGADDMPPANPATSTDQSGLGGDAGM